MAKHVTDLDANEFYQFFYTKHPELNRQFNEQEFCFANGHIYRFKPGKMSEEDYDKFEGIKNNWLKENGFR